MVCALHPLNGNPLNFRESWDASLPAHISKLGSQEAITEPKENVGTSAQTSPNLLALPDSKRHSRVGHRKVTCRQETVSLPPFKAARPCLCLPGRSRLRDADPILPPGQARREGIWPRAAQPLQPGSKVWVCWAEDATTNQPSSSWDSPLSRGPLRPSAPRSGPPPGPCTLDFPRQRRAPRLPVARLRPRDRTSQPALQANDRVPRAGVGHASLSPGGRPPRKPLVFV